MTWQNLPCPATLPAVSQFCPDGWLEVRVFQNPPLGALYPERTTFYVLKAWGIHPGDVDLVKYLRGEDFTQVPNWATVIVRVERGAGPGRGPRECDQCELKPVVDSAGNDWTEYDHEGVICPLHYLDDGSCDGTIKTRIWGNASWGVDGKPVYAEQPQWLVWGDNPRGWMPLETPQIRDQGWSRAEVKDHVDRDRQQQRQAKKSRSRVKSRRGF